MAEVRPVYRMDIQVLNWSDRVVSGLHQIIQFIDKDIGSDREETYP